ncbi:MAG: transposase [Bacteroidetes bacterium]|nr:MAG: transposase [Bacteroidota bacterium]PTM08694.1 MAG: transposase [Bacteroidota bacterium]
MHGHKIVNQNALHFLTMTVVGWLDVFSRQAYRDVLLDSFRHCQQEKGLVVNAYAIMSNHLHLIAYTKEGYLLSEILRDFKKYTSKQIIKQIIENPKESRAEWMLRLFKYYAKNNNNNETYQFWQNDNHPVELSSPNWIFEKLNYIHQNSVKNGLVEQPEHYLYSSARQYLGQEGLLEVSVIDLGFTEGYVPV